MKKAMVWFSCASLWQLGSDQPNISAATRNASCVSLGKQPIYRQRMPSRQAILYGSRERFLERGEIPIAVSCNWPQLFQDGALRAGDAFSGKDCLDAIFDSSI